MKEPPGAEGVPDGSGIEILPGRRASVGAFGVTRLLPGRSRRSIGAWCFVDHMGPGLVTEDRGLDIGPHPHMGLQTVTWLVAGEVLHRDSLGSEQVIRPGQLNLMTAGHGVSHSEEATGSYRGELHGVQLWVAQPSETRHGPAAFEHHGELPRVELRTGAGTVIVGDFAGTASPARRESEHMGLELDLRGGAEVVPLQRSFEHGIMVLHGTADVRGHPLQPGHVAYLPAGRDEVVVAADGSARLLLIGGVPFPEPLLMWWNFIGRDRSEIRRAHREWMEEGDRFGAVRSPLPRIVTEPPPWRSGRD